MMDFDLSQFLDLFIDEGQNYVQQLNACLLTLEADPNDDEALETMFRAAHSLKGGAATMGFEALAALSHATEDALDKIRRRRWALTPSLIKLLFAALDAMQTLLSDAAAHREPTSSAEAMIDQLRDYEPSEDDVPQDLPTPSSTILAQHKEPDFKTIDQTTPDSTLPKHYGPATMVRVDVRHLDTLLDIVTEMIIQRSQFNRFGKQFQSQEFDDALYVHQRLLAQLRDAVLGMRMTPVAQVFDRFPRMVRDLLKAQGKEAQFLIEGRGVEMDRTVVEALNEPLVHLLRNAIDHGLELPAERVRAGKSPTATLWLSAHRQRNDVIIEVSDDGRGIDPQRVIRAAIERGIVNQKQAEEMSKEQVLELICHPQLSLSKAVTTVSGRGVGMSVVKQQVNSLRGSLQIQTQLGKGATFRLQLPIMLALIQAILVRLNNELYALPTTQVERIIEINPAEIKNVGNQEIISLNGHVLPLQRLSTVLCTPDPNPQPKHALVVRKNGQYVGICVDSVLGHEEIVVKPLPAAYRDTPGLAGVTILGAGQTVLILDINQVTKIPR